MTEKKPAALTRRNSGSTRRRSLRASYCTGAREELRTVSVLSMLASLSLETLRGFPRLGRAIDRQYDYEGCHPFCRRAEHPE